MVCPRSLPCLQACILSIENSRCTQSTCKGTRWTSSTRRTNAREDDEDDEDDDVDVLGHRNVFVSGVQHICGGAIGRRRWRYTEVANGTRERRWMGAPLSLEKQNEALY